MQQSSDSGFGGFRVLVAQTGSIASGQDSLFSRAVLLLFSFFLLYVTAPPTALLLRLSFPFFPSAVSSPRGPYSQIGLHWGDKCWANALKHIQ